ncbi:TraR/DksA family transcriptional regulator [Naumannella cuiyingiana]|uniref:DnaK suppressor protein n=1 Tax=Naumannella cuiyingiana TaxID=1347891 RepID=A0A7Z0IM00_9ACTN|nr:TraR/DksA family transcriptional regulator [Naumannella cuiyingiana]NYI72108.1 DnaK suppressor protein [Naumannella cuiyingiana]
MPAKKRSTATAAKGRPAAAAASATEVRAPVDDVALAMPIRDGEEAWTRAEVDELRADLEADIDRHRHTIEVAEGDLAGLIRDGADNAGRDPADIGLANFERDQEMTLAHSAREALEQAREALRAIEQGRYGYCAECGNPIGKGRLQVHPRAVMCVECKQRAERR